MDEIDGLSINRLAEAKGLDADFLRRVGRLYERHYDGQPAVAFPVFAADGKRLHDRVRLADGTMRLDPPGAALTLYGLPWVRPDGPAVPVLLVEGETDTLSGIAHNWPVLGIPGVTSWRSEWAAVIREAAGKRAIVLWAEPDTSSGRPVRALILRLAADLPEAHVIDGDGDAKDLNELHQQCTTPGAFRQRLAAKLASAVRIGDRAELLRREIAAAQPRPRMTPTARQRHQAMYPEFAAAYERAKQRSIADVCTEHGIPLRGAGKERSAICPFHSDRRASLSVNIAKGVFHCHACGAKGDTITLVQRLRGLAFKDAVRAVAS